MEAAQPPTRGTTKTLTLKFNLVTSKSHDRPTPTPASRYTVTPAHHRCEHRRRPGRGRPDCGPAGRRCRERKTLAAILFAVALSQRLAAVVVAAAAAVKAGKRDEGVAAADEGGGSGDGGRHASLLACVTAMPGDVDAVHVAARSGTRPKEPPSSRAGSTSTGSARRVSPATSQAGRVRLPHMVARVPGRMRLGGEGGGEDERGRRRRNEE